tara:strand:+ start:743 stop:1105 length:363 start_codon:yes stop_codon:yes gene_type:complete
MTNILLTLIVALTIKIGDQTLSPKYYRITYEDGQRETVMVSKDNHICPSHCKVEHAHKVSICDNDQCEHIEEKGFVINKQEKSSNNFSLYCRGKEIMLFEQIQKDQPNKKKIKGNSIKLF